MRSSMEEMIWILETKGDPRKKNKNQVFKKKKLEL